METTQHRTGLSLDRDGTVEQEHFVPGRVLRVTLGVCTVAFAVWMLAFPAFFPITTDAAVNTRVVRVVDAGDRYVEVDPSSAVVEAWFHQRYLPDVRPGDRALVHLLGTSEQVVGTVESVQVDPADPSWAWSTPHGEGTCFRAVVRLDAGPLVPGHRAKVLLVGAEADSFEHTLLRLYALGEL